MSGRNRHVGAWAIVAAVVGVAAFVLIRSADITSDRNPTGATRTPPSSSTMRVPASTAGALPSPSGETGIAALKGDFARLQTQIGGKIGLVIAPAGDPNPTVTFGQWTTGPAWSTIKVPLIIAALRKNDPPQVTDPMRAAITHSDNAAAESIWQGLGEPTAAAHAVEQVLIEAGDPTPVEWRKRRPQYTAFGQTMWSLQDQVRFGAFAACDGRDEPVRALMGQIEQDQRWGLGVIPNAEFKGGWGPSEDGRYLVRQFGFITNPSDGTVSAVAMAVEPVSGSLADGTADLTKIAEWLNGHIALLPAGHCEPRTGAHS